MHLLLSSLLQQLANEENLRKQEESVQKQEAMRRGKLESFLSSSQGVQADQSLYSSLTPPGWLVLL